MRPLGLCPRSSTQEDRVASPLRCTLLSPSLFPVTEPWCWGPSRCPVSLSHTRHHTKPKRDAGLQCCTARARSRPLPVSASPSWGSRNTTLRGGQGTGGEGGRTEGRQLSPLAVKTYTYTKPTYHVAACTPDNIAERAGEYIVCLPGMFIFRTLFCNNKLLIQ